MPTFYSGPADPLLSPWWTEHVSKMSKEQRRKVLDAARFQRTPPGLTHTFAQMGKPSVMAGLLFDPLKAFAQQGASSLLNIAQATMPNAQDLHAIPGFDTATEALGLKVDPYVSAEGAGGLGKAAALRVARVGNAATMGMSDLLLRRLGATIPKGVANPVTGEAGEQLTPVDQLPVFAKGLASHIGMDLLPGEEAARLLTGEQADGTPLTPREVGSLISSGVLKTALAKQLIPGIQSRQLRNTLGELSSKKMELRSRSEIEAAGRARETRLAQLAEDRKAAKAAAQELGLTPREAARVIENRFVDPETQRLTEQVLPPEVKEAYKSSMDTELLNPDELAQLGQEVVKSDIFAELAERTARADKSNIRKGLQKEPTPYTAVAAKAMEEGALSVRSLQQIAEIHDLPTEQLASRVAELYSRTSKLGGQTLQAVHEGAVLALNELAHGVRRGDAASVKQWLRLKRIHQNSGAMSMFDAYSNNAMRKIETVRLGSLLMQPATAMRNITVQGANFLNQIVEHLNSGVIEEVYGKKAGEVRPRSSYFADVVGDFAAFADQFKGANFARGAKGREKARANRELLSNIIEENPLMAMDLLGGDMFEIGNEVLSSMFRLKDLKGPKAAVAKIKQAHELGIDYTTIYSNILTSATRMQEMWFRKLFFESSLRGNIERIGIKDFTELLQEVQRPKMREDVRGALVDAWTNSKKQTFSHAPEGGPFKSILDFYHKHPAMTSIGVPFPRFTMNVFRWLYEHNPDMMFEAFTPDVKKALYEGAAGGFKSRDAARKLGKAVDGLLLLGTAYSIRTSEMAGPKYYQLKVGDKLTDTRSDLPFTTALGLAELVKLAQQNIPWDEKVLPIYSANEIGDLLFNIRSSSEVPALAFVDALRSLGTYDAGSIAKAFLTPAGQWISGFLMPGKFLNDAYAIATGSEKARETKLLEGHEFWGPIAQNVPGLRNTLDPKFSPVTGKPEGPTYTEHALRTITGLNLKSSPLLEKVLFGVPGIKFGEVAGRHKDPDATNLVRKYMGEALSEPLGPGVLEDFQRTMPVGDPKLLGQARSVGDLLAVLSLSEYKNSEGKFQPLAPSEIAFNLETILKPIREEAEAKAKLANPKLFREDFMEKIEGSLKDFISMNNLGTDAIDALIKAEAQEVLGDVTPATPALPLAPPTRKP